MKPLCNTRPARLSSCAKSRARACALPVTIVACSGVVLFYSTTNSSLRFNRDVAIQTNARGRPAHHVEGGFINPWPSYVEYSPLDFFSIALPELRKLVTYELPRVTPEWESITDPSHELQATWLGHSTFLVQAAGWNVLTDPVFSQRTSPVPGVGPLRYTPPACAVDDLPLIHIVLISHNHYDHLDWDSVTSLLNKEKRDLAAAAAVQSGSINGRAARRRFTGMLWVAPLGVKSTLASLGVAADRIVELDWWDEYRPEILQDGAISPQAAGGTVTHRRSSATRASAIPAVNRTATASTAESSPPTVICVPAQHQSARTLFNRNAALWAGFAVIVPTPRQNATAERADLRFYFAGDTGYRAVPVRDPPIEPGSPDEDALPFCPAFKEVGKRYGPFDLSLLPIGAYSPRVFMSSFHATPEDAVAMHVDVRSRLSVGMHWGAFPVTDEPIEEPPVRLRAALQRRNMSSDGFVAVWPGGTVAAGVGPLRPEHRVSAPSERYAQIAGAGPIKTGWWGLLDFSPL